MSPQNHETGISDEEPDPRSTREYYERWLNIYKATMGKLIEMPAVGPAREKSERTMKGLSTFINLYEAGMDINSNLQGVFTKAMRRVQEKTAKDMDGDSPDKLKEFYRIWMETYSEAFKEFSKSDHFVSDLGRLNSCLIDFQQNNREMIEENFLKPMNLPTKKEIVEIYKELYSLKKTVKELVMEIKELKKNK